jgi:hypothetical protein
VLRQVIESASSPAVSVASTWPVRGFWNVNAKTGMSWRLADVNAACRRITDTDINKHNALAIRQGQRIFNKAKTFQPVRLKCLRAIRQAGSHAGDELLHPLIDRAERVLAQHGPLGLVVELEVHPVDGEITAPFLGPADELTAQPRPGGLRRH